MEKNPKITISKNYEKLNVNMPNIGRSLLADPHGADDGCGPFDDVAACKDAGL